jgi:hypothetical protein
MKSRAIRGAICCALILGSGIANARQPTRASDAEVALVV